MNIIKLVFLICILTLVSSCNNKEKSKYAPLTNKQELHYTKLGLQYAMRTKSVLGQNLVGAIKTKGTIGALLFCNEKAYTLTDSMAILQKAVVKRVSDKYRNPNNSPNTKELEYIKQAKKIISEGGKATPTITEMDDKIIGYYPIITHGMCLQCHGEPSTEIKINTLNKIQEFYPNDKAIDYQINELRGIWVVEIDNKE